MSDNDEESMTPVEAEIHSESGNITVPLGPDGAEIEVLPMKQWKSRAIRYLNDGDIESWAELSLTEDSYDLWCDVDPTMQMVEDFFEAWSKSTGQNPNLSRQQRRASNRMKRR